MITFLSLNNFSFDILENIVIPITAEVNIVKRDGKDYITISHMYVSTDLSYFKMNHRYKNVPSFITNMINKIINSSWKMIKPLMDHTINRFVRETLNSIVTPMFNEISLQDFFNMNV